MSPLHIPDNSTKKEARYVRVLCWILWRKFIDPTRNGSTIPWSSSAYSQGLVLLPYYYYYYYYHHHHQTDINTKSINFLRPPASRLNHFLQWGRWPTRCNYGNLLIFKLAQHSSIKRDQLDVTCFIISLLNAQHVSDVNTSILRSLGLICWVISWVVLVWFDVCWCHVVVWLGWCGIRMQAEALVPQTA